MPVPGIGSYAMSNTAEDGRMVHSRTNFADSPSLELLCEIFTDQSRRVALSYLLEHGSVETTNLLQHVAATENRDDSTVLLNFHHIHLPKMAEAGLLSYDERWIHPHDLSAKIDPIFEDWIRSSPLA